MHTEPKWMAKLDEMVYPIVFILVILTISMLTEDAQAQDKKICVDEWRLVKAEQELILLDSLVRDFKEKDSVISDLKARDTVRLSEISNLQRAFNEKVIQTGMHRDLAIGYINQIHVVTRQKKKIAWQRNGAVAVAIALTVKILFF